MSDDNEDYDLQRIEFLIRGEQPQGLREELFVRAYAGMIMGEDQIMILNDIALCFDEMGVKDWHFYNLGLAMGERDYKMAKEEMEESVNNYNKKTTH